MAVDYSVYLVTGPPPARAGPGRRLDEVVGAALRGGATAVQLRDKAAPDAAVAAAARRLLPLTRARGVPLLVNDRVTVARDVGADGVHLGQDDMGAPIHPLPPLSLSLSLIFCPPLVFPPADRPLRG